MTTATYKKILQLQAEIRDLQDTERAEQEAVKKSVKPVRVYTMLPAEENYDRIMDPSVTKYRLECTVTNKDELIKVGWSGNDLSTGGMTYLYNTLSHRVIGSFSGGSVLISDGKSFWGADPESCDRAWAQIEAFLINHPEGGDVSAIVEEYNKANNIHQ